MTEIPKYDEADLEPQPGDLEALSSLAQVQRDLELQIEEKEEELKKLKEEHRSIAWTAIPEKMDELELETFTTKSGLVITISEELRTSMPKAKAAEGCNWLEENDLGDIIKRAFIIRFNRGDEAWAAKFERDCKQRKKPLDIDRTTEVPSATLKKVIKELLEDGVDVPMELFGAHRQRIAKIKMKKSPGKKG